MPVNTKNLPSQKLFYYANLQHFPLHMAIIISLFAGIGLLNMYSISLAKGSYYFQRFALFWLFSLVPFFLVCVTNIRYFIKFSYGMYALSIGCLGLLFVIGNTSMGATRWIDFGIIKFQPSELAKLSIIFAIARYYHFSKTFTTHSILKAIFVLAMAVVPFGLTAMQPDLGSALIILFVATLMIFASGIRSIWIIIVIISIACAMPFVWHKLHDYQKDRILIFLDPEKDPKGAGYNVIQSKIAIGSGGFIGKGYTQNDQSSLKFLPENQTDFAFTVFAEEFGFMGSCIILSLFIYIIFYGVFVSLKCKYYYGKMLAFGVTSLLFLHVSINLMMITGFLPVVGIPLPFVSYGGSFLMLCMICLAILINIDITGDMTIQSTVKTYMLK